MGHLGLEPRTIRLKAEYSTIELVTLSHIISYNNIIQNNSSIFHILSVNIFYNK